MAPAMSENSMIGSVVEACTRAMRSADAPMDVISQAAPTDWISPPKLEARLAIQTARKIGCRKGDKEDTRRSNAAVSFTNMEDSILGQDQNQPGAASVVTLTLVSHGRPFPG